MMLCFDHIHILRMRIVNGAAEKAFVGLPEAREISKSSLFKLRYIIHAVDVVQ